MDLSLVGMTQSADHSQSVTQIAVLGLDSYAQFNTICSESLSKLKRGVLFMKNNWIVNMFKYFSATAVAPLIPV